MQNSHNQVLSKFLLKDWRGSLSIFDGAYNTIPKNEIIDATWDEISDVLRPNDPLVIEDKTKGTFILPCQLREAPLVGKTLEAAEKAGKPTTGKMRSKNHVIKASILIFDIDDMTQAEFDALLELLKKCGITYIIYTTYSHGDPNKPGMRIRVVVPIDRPVGSEEYTLAWHGFNQRFLNGKADQTGAKLCQLQGTWSCHPSRIDQAESSVNDAGVVSTDVLMKLGQQTQQKQPAQYNQSEKDSNKSYPPSDANKIADKCNQIREFRDTKGAKQSEPLWRDSLGVVGHCQDGENLFQEWSSGHPGYDESKTAKKLADRMKYPPTTCAQFKKTNPAGCDGCTQSCNSPITLGREDDEEFEELEYETVIIGSENPSFDQTETEASASNTTTAPTPTIPNNDEKSEAILGADKSCETKNLAEAPSSSVPIKPVEKPDDVKRNATKVNTLDNAKPLDPESFPNKPSQGSHQIPATIPNTQHLLESYRITPRYNAISKKLMITIPGFSGMPDNTDNSAFAQIISLATLNTMQIGQLKNYIAVIADRNPINPIADWINNKPWDGNDRIKAICDTLVQRPDFPEELKIILVEKWLLSAVAAALMPSGFKSRGVLTIQGPQSIGKTAWVNALVPDEALREIAILLDHHLDASSKDSIITAICHWIVEIGELDSSFKKDIARLKGFLTKTFDKLRRPYDVTDSNYPRRTVFCATVNDNNFLVDSTGNTRWWTVPVIEINYRHNIDMQQLFAQLAVDFHAGKQWWLTDEEEKLLEQHNASHRQISVIREKILEFIDLDYINAPNLRAMTAIEVLTAAGIDKPTNQQCKECGGILRELLGNPKRIKGRDKWRIPEEPRQTPNYKVSVDDIKPIDSNDEDLNAF